MPWQSSAPVDLPAHSSSVGEGDPYYTPTATPLGLNNHIALVAVNESKYFVVFGYYILKCVVLFCSSLHPWVCVCVCVCLHLNHRIRTAIHYSDHDLIMI